MRRITTIGLIFLVWATASNRLLQAGESGVVEVKLGETVERTWDQVKAGKYAYGPKQDYNAKTNETHVYLPYGKNTNLYHEVRGVLYDPTTGDVAKFHSSDGNTNAVLTYKLRFDQRIASFRFYSGWAELGLSGGTVGGVEYSVDGQDWKPVVEVKKSGIIEPLVKDFKATDMNTGTLYIRYFTRDPVNPDASGPGRWLQFRMAGSPGWGDAATTFFASQPQLWVTPAKGAAAPPKASASEAEPATAPRSGDAWARENGSPWSFSSSAEWFKEYPRFNPMMAKAGATWIRAFYEWSTIQPRQGQWNWALPDALVANCRKNNIQVSGLFCYLTSWASADGGVRKFPVKDMNFWREYVRTVMNRYQKDILYWEVGNEWNGSFGPGCTPKVYADMTVAAYEEARKVNKDIKIGMSVANFDVGFLDAAIKAGAADHFDFIAVHPYENVGSLTDGGEVSYLSLAGNLRDMLKANRQRTDIPLWITEFGFQAPVQPDAKADALQAEIFAKAHLLAIVQGFSRLCWFEARGPAYGRNTDHGLIRADWTPRPAYHAYATMTSLLGAQPHYLGWLNVADGGYGFVFDGPKGAVLATWAPPGKKLSVRFANAVQVVDLSGKESPLAAGGELTLTTTPVYVAQLPEALVAEAKDNRGKPYPWGGDYANAKRVTCRLGAMNVNNGLKQVNPQTTAIVVVGDISYRRSDFTKGGEGHYVYFRADPQFVPYGTRELEITIIAKRVSSDKEAGMKLTYESARGYRDLQGPNWWTIPEGDQWQEHTWKVSDANFVGQWGWNFRFDAVGSPNEYLIREVRVEKTR